MKACCEKCNEIFNYKKVLNLVIGKITKLTCKNCGITYKIKIRYKILNSLLISLPILYVPFLPFLGSQFKYFLLFLIYILYIAFIMLLSPLFIKLTK